MPIPTLNKQEWEALVKKRELLRERLKSKFAAFVKDGTHEPAAEEGVANLRLATGCLCGLGKIVLVCGHGKDRQFTSSQCASGAADVDADGGDAGDAYSGAESCCSAC